MTDEARKLSHEDRIIWAQVARTVEAFPGKSVDTEDWFAITKPRSEPPRPEPAEPDPTAASIRQPGEALQPRFHTIEQPVVRKLARGRLPIDGRIDLHGLTQSEAHNLLLGFLTRAHERGLRHVLVITGKGSSRGSDGALKRMVPQWLAKPEFRFLISGHEEAARSHGGEGALYIRLRRERSKAR